MRDLPAPGGRRRTPRRRPGAAAALGLLAVLVASAPLAAQEWKEFRAARQAQELESLAVEVVYGAGSLGLAAAEGRYLYDVRMRFDAARFAPVRVWDRTGSAATLRVGLTSASSDSGGEIRLGEDFRFDLERLDGLGDSAGRLSLALSPDVPTDLEVKAGAAESDLELGGLALTRLSVETGASATNLSFSRPNAVPMEELSLRLGAAELETSKLGNAGFERFSFQGGVGDVLLDFTGEWRRNASASIKMGVGALTLRFPKDLGVRIRKSSFLTSFDADGFTREGDSYRTANWSDAEQRLELDLNAAFGSISVQMVP